MAAGVRDAPVAHRGRDVGTKGAAAKAITWGQKAERIVDGEARGRGRPRNKYMIRLKGQPPVVGRAAPHRNPLL